MLGALNTPRFRRRRKVEGMRRIVLLVASLCLCSISFAQQTAQTKPTTGPSEVKIGGAVKTPFTVTAQDLKNMPRNTMRVENPHSQKTEVYEGVPLAVLLQKAGVPAGEQIRGAVLATYVVVDAVDDYRVVFSLAELDSGFMDSEVLLADTMDGAPLGAGLGPFRLVAPHEKRPARWVDMVRSITVGRVPN
jgi:DMSO/TMAO reductase YedYZ molybdopterin-dependent catalytic subunit